MRDDLEVWRTSQRAKEQDLIFPGEGTEPWTLYAHQTWRRKDRAFGRALAAAGVEEATPCTLRHSFASLLHEGRSVIYVARQLGHDARLTLSRHGHVIDELEDQPRVAAEDAIVAARASTANPA